MLQQLGYLLTGGGSRGDDGVPLLSSTAASAPGAAAGARSAETSSTSMFGGSDGRDANSSSANKDSTSGSSNHNGDGGGKSGLAAGSDPTAVVIHTSASSNSLLGGLGARSDSAVSLRSAQSRTDIHSEGHSQSHGAGAAAAGRAPPLSPTPQQRQQQQQQRMAFVGGTLIVVLNTSTVLCKRASAKQGGVFHYNPGAVILLSELAKFLSMLVVVLATGEFSWPAPRKLLNFSVPALLYAVNNIIMFYSIAMLGPASSQLVYSLKILTTALTLKLALRRYYSTMQWLAIALLTAGCVISQFQVGGESLSLRGPLMGYVLTIFMCFLSSSAAVSNEFLLKETRGSIFYQNMQLYFWGVVICLMNSVYEYAVRLRDADGGLSGTPAAGAGGLGAFAYVWGLVTSITAGFSLLEWGIAIMQTIDGISISVVMKYADSNVKNACASLAMVLVALISSWVGWESGSVFLFVGIVAVCLSMHLYVNYGRGTDGDFELTWGNVKWILQESWSKLRRYFCAR